MDRNKLLERAHGDEERLLLAKVLDRQQQAEQKNIPACTDFLSPHERALAEDVLRAAGISPETYVASGGYEGAERQALLFLPDWQIPEMAEFPFRYLRAAYRPEYQLSHRDFLGSLMGMGIVREKVGDLLVGSQSCDLIVADSVAEFLLREWTQAGRAPLKLSAIGAEDLTVPEVRCEEVRDTVQSLRLDAVAATGFKLSRGKAADLIESGHVELNWRECVKPDRPVAEGDTVSARGFGKFKLEQVSGTTRKGRTGIVLKRYI
jgi:RNA-binding protein YlmH